MSFDNSLERGLKACRACASAKVRCEVLAGQTKCKRCQRLNKECAIQPRRRHSRKEVAGGYSREDILRLESKVDSVANFLSSSSSSTPALAENSPLYLPNNLGGSASDSSALSLFLRTIPQDSVKAFEILDLFRREMAPLFPFVVISPETTPAALLHEKPVLFMAVMVVGCQSDVDTQLSLARILQEEISRRILIGGEKSLGLLQGLLVYLAWNQAHMQLNSQLPTLLHIAFAMMTELNLDKERTPPAKTALGGLREFSLVQSPRPETTLEERRTLLGVLWISSTSTTSVRDVGGMRLSNLADKSCQVLEEAMQFPSDLYLTQLVRIQQTADTIRATLYNDLLEPEPNMSAMVSMAMSSLETEVEKIEITLSREIPQGPLLMMTYHALQVYLYKIGLDDRLFPTSWMANVGSSPSSPYILQRTRFLVSCLNAVKSVAEQFLALADSVVLSLPYHNWAQLGHAILIFSRLLTVNRDAWDPSLVSGVPGFLNTLESIKGKLEAAISSGARATPPRGLPRILETVGPRLTEVGRMVTESSNAVGSGSGACSNAGETDLGNLSEPTTLFNQDNAMLFTLFEGDEWLY